MSTFFKYIPFEWSNLSPDTFEGKWQIYRQMRIVNNFILIIEINRFVISKQVNQLFMQECMIVPGAM